MEAKKFLTAAEVAEEFGLNPETLQQLVDSGDLRALADRGTWKYRRDELQGLVDAGRIPGGVGGLAGSDPLIAPPSAADDVSYIELDEAALEAALGSSPPSEEYPVAISESDADFAIPDSDSDVHIAPEYEAPRAEDSGILLDFSLDAGATVSSSGSSLRLPQTVPGAIEDAAADDGTEPAAAWDESESVTTESESGVLGDDFGSHLGRVEESGILLDDGSHVGLPGGSSVLASSPAAMDSGLALQPDSGIALVGGHDSGISLEPHADSGLALESHADSGLALDAGDSGLALGSVDSGLSLEQDSGISLGLGDSGLAIDDNAKTMPDSFVLDDEPGDRTQTLELSTQSDDSEFEINLDDGDATTELVLDDDDADAESATVVRKGRPAPGSLSEAFELDDAEVEDLEISQDLDAGIEDEVELAEEEVFDSSDDMFGEVEAEPEEDEEDYLAPAAKSKKAAGPREPSWGAGMTIGLVACTLFLAANTLILWAGVSTMWNGAEVQGPAASLIQPLAELIK